MRILLAADEHAYSQDALNETARLAANTWADVTLLGVGRSGSGDSAMKDALRNYREQFLNHWEQGGSPYESQESQFEWLAAKAGGWEEIKIVRGSRKSLRVRLREGNPATETLQEARADESDLIVLGCSKGEKCLWEGGKAIPQEIVNAADCSVLLVKEDQPVRRILACLDQGYISQESLEMINQMLTIHGAQLEFIGLSQNGDMNKAVYTRLIEIGDYYSDRQVDINIRVTDVSEFEKFVTGEVHDDLLALWMGKKSLLSKFFSRDWVGRFVSKCQTSVLVMR